MSEEKTTTDEKKPAKVKKPSAWPSPSEAANLLVKIVKGVTKTSCDAIKEFKAQQAAKQASKGSAESAKKTE